MEIMDDRSSSAILQLPVEILQRIARFVDQQSVVRFQGATDLTALLHFRLTCKAFERASFDVLVERFPKRLRCYVNIPRNIQNFKAQSSQPRLISRLKQVTLAVDILAGSHSGDINTVENVGQDLETAQLLEYQRHETDFYECISPISDADLSPALQRLQALGNPPAVKIFVWLSEDIYLKHQESKAIVSTISNIMTAVPSHMLRSLQLADVHCDPQILLRLLRESRDTLEEFIMDNVSFISSRMHWTDVLAELALCSDLKHLMLCNLREECWGAVLSTRQQSPFSPFSDYFYAAFSGLGRVKDGLRSLIEADLCASDSNRTDEEEHI